MIVRLAGGRVVDPSQGESRIGDLWIADGRLVAPPKEGIVADAVVDCAGTLIMAGAIDVNAPVAGYTAALRRLMDPEGAGLPAATIARQYAGVGYTLVVDPAMMPTQALHTQLELADMAGIDRAALAAVGNDDRLLRTIAEGGSRVGIATILGRVVAGCRALGLSAVAPGASAAFHDGMSVFRPEDVLCRYGLSGVALLDALIDAGLDLGLAHPLHLSAPATPRRGDLAALVAVAAGRPLHISALERFAIAEPPETIVATLANAPSITADIGGDLFAPPAVATLDPGVAPLARRNPSAAVVLDGDAEAAFVVRRPDTPDRIRQGDDAWRAARVLAGTLAASGRLMLAGCPVSEAEHNDDWSAFLGCLADDVGLDGIARLTRLAPAGCLGVDDRGRLSPSAVADIAIYADLGDPGRSLRRVRHLFKDGRMVVRDGRPAEAVAGHTLQCDLDAEVDDALATDYCIDRFGAPPGAFAVTDAAFDGRPMFLKTRRGSPSSGTGGCR